MFELDRLFNKWSIKTFFKNENESRQNKFEESRRLEIYAETPLKSYVEGVLIDEHYTFTSLTSIFKL